MDRADAVGPYALVHHGVWPDGAELACLADPEAKAPALALDQRRLVVVVAGIDSGAIPLPSGPRCRQRADSAAAHTQNAGAQGAARRLRDLFSGLFRAAEPFPVLAVAVDRPRYSGGRAGAAGRAGQCPHACRLPAAAPVAVHCPAHGVAGRADHVCAVHAVSAVCAVVGLSGA